MSQKETGNMPDQSFGKDSTSNRKCRMESGEDGFLVLGDCPMYLTHTQVDWNDLIPMASYTPIIWAMPELFNIGFHRHSESVRH